MANNDSVTQQKIESCILCRNMHCFICVDPKNDLLK